MQDGAELTALDTLLEIDPARMKTPVVAEAERHAGIIDRDDRGQRRCLARSQRLFAEHVLASGGTSHDLVRVTGRWGRQNDRIDLGAAQQLVHAADERELVLGAGVAVALRLGAAHSGHEADQAAALHRLHQRATPPAQSGDCCPDQLPPLDIEPAGWSKRRNSLILRLYL